MTDINAAAKEFVRWALRISFEGCDADGASIQEKAESLGLIKHTRYDPAIHGPHDDLVYGDPYYVFHDQLKEPTP